MGQLNFFNRRDQNPCYFSSNLVAFWNREFTAEFMNKSITRNESMILCYSWVTWYTSMEWASVWNWFWTKAFVFQEKKIVFFLPNQKSESCFRTIFKIVFLHPKFGHKLLSFPEILASITTSWDGKPPKTSTDS